MSETIELKMGETYEMVTESGPPAGKQITYIRVLEPDKVRLYMPWQPQDKQVETVYVHSELQLHIGRTPARFFEKPSGQPSNGWGLGNLRSVDCLDPADVPEQLLHH